MMLVYYDRCIDMTYTKSTHYDACVSKVGGNTFLRVKESFRELVRENEAAG